MKHIVLTADVFDAKVYVYFDCTFKEMAASVVTGQLGFDFAFASMDDNGESNSGQMISNGSDCLVYIRSNHFPVFVHELCHVVHAILHDRQIAQDYDNMEVYAYLYDHLFEQAINALNLKISHSNEADLEDAMKEYCCVKK